MVSDQQIVLNQVAAWRTLFEWVEKEEFELSAVKACVLYLIAAKDDALEWGRFRFGGVTIAGTDYMPPGARVTSSD